MDNGELERAVECFHKSLSIDASYEESDFYLNECMGVLKEENKAAWMKWKKKMESG